MFGVVAFIRSIKWSTIRRSNRSNAVVIAFAVVIAAVILVDVFVVEVVIRNARGNRRILHE